MAWNESGNGNKDPWGGGNQEGPPDLDKIVRDWQKRFNAIFGGTGGGAGSGRQPSDGANSAMVLGVAILLTLGWLATGFYRVDDAERGVVLLFGKYSSTAMPGLRWHVPWPIESVEKVNINAVNRFNQQTRMLTADENIVVVDLVVQYQNLDPVAYLFQVREPDATLSDASESAIREVIGQAEMDYILGTGRAEIALNTQAVIQEAIDEYGVGINVTKVNLQDVNFPSQVEAAVQDAIKAREDEERLGFEAQTYANDILPKARGEASRRLQDAEGYKARVVANAEGEAARFEKLLTEYRRAPRVTRDRLYIEAIEDVFNGANVVLMDSGQSGNLLYLPIDKMLENKSQTNGGAAVTRPRVPSTGQDPGGNASRASQDARQRGSR
ncbi:MAG: FtsH protease activity modulator HflK [Gammaproteobacteria bacterium]